MIPLLSCSLTLSFLNLEGLLFNISDVSLSLMFCAGLMAISFWAIRGSYDLFWWGVNLWLILLSLWALGYKLFRNDE